MRSVLIFKNGEMAGAGSDKQAFPDVDIFLPPLADHTLKDFVTMDGFGASFANTTAAMKAAVREKGQRVGLCESSH